MANPPSSSGTDIETLKIGVDTSEASTGASDLDKLGTATIKSIKSINDLSVAVEKNADWMARVNAGYKNQIQVLNAKWEADQRALKSAEDIIRVQEQIVEQGSRYIAKLEEMVATYNFSTAALQRYKAEQLGVIAEAEPLIVAMEQMAAATKKYGVTITEVSQIEAARVAWEQANMTALNAQRQRYLAEQAAMEESAATSLNAQRVRMMAENRAAAIKDINEMEAIRLADIEKQKADAIAFNAFKIRTMNENRAEADRILIAQEEAAIKLAEKQAIEEIKWTQMSVKGRIAELERLKLYQAESAIRPETTAGLFSSAAIKDLPNLQALIAQYNETLANTHGHTTRATDATNGLGQAFANNRVRTEALVIAHEGLQGRFTRMPGSIMVMIEYLSAAGNSMMGLGVSGLAAAAGIAAFVYEMYRGQAQSKAFNDSIFRTNNFAGETRSSMEALAQSVGKLHGEYTNAYEAAAALNNTGKFTKDQIEQITSAVVNLEHAFGTKLNVSIKEFESLSVRGTSMAASGNMQVSKALEKLDEQYHFVTVSLMQQIIELDKEGKAREASRIAIDAWGKESERASKESVENIGWIETAWHGVTKAIKSTIQAMADVGKKSTDGNKEQTLINLLPKNKDGSLVTDENKMSQTDLMRYKQFIALEKELSDAGIAANKVALETQQRSDANHTLMLRALEDKRLMKKSENELQDALKKNAEENRVIELADPGYSERNAKYLADREAAIIKAHTQKVQGIKNDGRKSILADNLAADKAEYDQAKEAADATEKLLKEWADSGQITRQTEYNSIPSALHKQLASLEEMKKDELATMAKYKPLSDADAAAAIKRTNDVSRSYELAALKIRDATELSQQKVIDKAVSDTNKTDDAELKALTTKIEKQKQYMSEIGKTNEQKELAKQKIDDEAASQNELEAVLLDIYIKTNELGVVEQATASAHLESLRLKIKGHKEYNDLLGEAAIKEAAASGQRELDKEYERFNKKFGDDFTAAIIDGGDKGIEKLLRNMEISFAKLILQPILQPINNAVTGFLYPNATQAGGAGAASGAGGVGGAVGMANAAANAYKALSSGFSSLASGAGSMVSGFGNLIGSSSISAFGSGMGMTSAQAAAASAAYGGTGTATGSAISAGSSAGSVASVAAGVYAGIKIGSAISGDYGSHSTVNAGTAIGTGVGYYVGGPFGAAVGAALGGVIGGALNRVFGMGSKETTATGMKGTISDSGVTGNNYSTWHQDGGWFRSDKNGTDTSALTDVVVSSFTSGLATMKAVSSDFAKTLGIGADSLKGYSKDFDILLDPLKEVKGNAAEQAAITAENDSISAKNDAAITKFFTTIGDDLANRLIPNMSAFALVGETASVTLERLSNTFKVTDDIANMLGMDTVKAFGAVGLGSDAARERLVNLAGGLQNLTALTSSYATNYLSDAQKLEPAQKAVAAAIKEMGLESVTTKAGFKAVVDGLKLTNAEDAALFINLMKIQDAFAMVSDGADKLAQDAKDAADKIAKDAKDAADKIAKDAQDAADAAKELADKKLQDALKNTDLAYTALSKSISAEKDKLNASYDAEVKSIKANTDALKTAAQARLTAAQDSLKESTKVFDMLSNSLKSVGIESAAMDAAQRRQGQAYLQTALNNVQGGASLKDQKGLETALAAVGKSSTGMFSTFLDYARDQAKTVSVIARLKEQAGAEVNYGQLTVDGINATITQIEKSGQDALDLAEAHHNAQIEALDKILAVNQEQLDSANGLDTTLKSLAEALASFKGYIAGANATKAAEAAGGGKAGNTTGLETLYKSLFGRDSDAAGLKFWQDQMDKGVSLSEIGKSFTDSKEYKDLHPFADGTNYIPKDMPAYLHEGEAVIPKADNRALMSSVSNNSSNNNALLSEVKALRQAVEKFEASNSAENIAMQRDGATTAKFIKRWDGNGIPQERITVTAP